MKVSVRVSVSVTVSVRLSDCVSESDLTVRVSEWM